MANPVVNIQVSIQTAPLPDNLQKTGAFVSSGGTITLPNTKTVLTQLSDLTSLLVQPAAISSINYVGGNADVQTVNPHNLPVGEVIILTIAGVTPSGYNGTYPCTITANNTFQYALPLSPGAVSVEGTFVNAEAQSLVERATTFFAQGTAQSVYVLELGPLDATNGTAALNAYITANPSVFYSYLVPRYWDANAAFLAMLATFESTSAKTYFYVTTTLSTYRAYAGIKSVIWLIEAPAYGQWAQNTLTGLSWNNGVATASTTSNHGVSPGQWFQISGANPAGFNGWWQAQLGTTGTTLIWNIATNPGTVIADGTLVSSPYASTGVGANEFSLASIFRTTLNYAPSSTNKVTPLNFAYEFGVTQFPQNGNAGLISTILGTNGNLIGPSPSGSASPTMVLGGKYADGKQFKYWYSVDWVQINLYNGLINALVNGANNPANPLDYNQPGIDTLQQRAASIMTQGASAALVLDKIASTTLTATQLQQAIDLGTYDGVTLVNADPFASYVTENPNDYMNGVYDGIYVDYTPQLGFENILVNVTVNNFATG